MSDHKEEPDLPSSDDIIEDIPHFSNYRPGVSDHNVKARRYYWKQWRNDNMKQYNGKHAAFYNDTFICAEDTLSRAYEILTEKTGWKGKGRFIVHVGFENVFVDIC